MNRRFALPASVLLLAGCSVAEIDTTYGRRRGSPGEESVNGTAVLASLFEQAGHRVTTWRRLSPKLEESRTIVWFPDDFQPPTQEQRTFLERWLAKQPGRTLVYVGRDYDAAVIYWRHIQPTAPPEQAGEIARRVAVAQATHDRRRARMPKDESCGWFVMKRDAPRGQPRFLAGPWAADLDGKQAGIELAGRLEIPQDADPVGTAPEGYLEQPRYEQLLSSQQDTLVGRITWEEAPGSQLLFVANGSFLLNLPLVNREHRLLAQRLVAACGPPGKTVFLESEEGGPEVYDTEPGVTAPTGFEVFTVWPLGVILVHLTALGILACIAFFPVFGRPRELLSPPSSDFGQHVEALGKLLEETGNREYAWQRLRAYHEQVRRDSTPKLP